MSLVGQTDDNSLIESRANCSKGISETTTVLHSKNSIREKRRRRTRNTEGENPYVFASAMSSLPVGRDPDAEGGTSGITSLSESKCASPALNTR